MSTRVGALPAPTSATARAGETRQLAVALPSLLVELDAGPELAALQAEEFALASIGGAPMFGAEPDEAVLAYIYESFSSPGAARRAGPHIELLALVAERFFAGELDAAAIAGGHTGGNGRFQLELALAVPTTRARFEQPHACGHCARWGYHLVGCPNEARSKGT